MNKKKKDILTGSIWDQLLFFAVPLILSSLLQMMFNIADQAVVGRFAGSQALAAVGANTSLVNLFVNVFGSISIGANVMIARKIGEGNTRDINGLEHTALTFAMVCGGILLILGLILAVPVLNLMGTPEDIIDMAVLYFRIYCIGFPFAVVYNFGAAILRSVGDTKRPMICLMTAGILNVVLNVILVVGFHMGVAGVSIATTLSNITSCCGVIYFLIKEKDMLHMEWKKLGIRMEYLKPIFQIGAPAALQSAVFSVANVSIQSGVNSLGSYAVAGSAAASNFEFMSYMIMNGFSQATVTFCGQNHGARQMERCRKILKVALAEAIVLTAIYDVVCFFAKVQLGSIFTTDPVVADFIYQRIFVVVLVHFLISLYEVPGAAMRGMGYSLGPALLTIIGSVGFRILWLFTIFRWFPTFRMLLTVYPASWILTAILTLGYYALIRKKIYA